VPPVTRIRLRVVVRLGFVVSTSLGRERQTRPWFGWHSEYVMGVDGLCNVESPWGTLEVFEGTDRGPPRMEEIGFVEFRDANDP
jgi:hypothetical protein